MEQILRKLVDEDKIAAEVARRLEARRVQLFSWPVRALGVLVALSAVLDGGYRIYMIVVG